MFSPQERVYNTPDISVPAAKAILQQIRLERVLKRFGYFACCKQTTGNGVEPPIGNQIPPHKRPATLYPLLTEPYPLLNEPKFPRRPVRGTAKKPREPVEVTPQKSPRSRIPGAPVNDPYLQKTRDTVGGCKYGGVHLTDSGLQPIVNQPSLFKPFYPQRSPLRLPAIQREKSTGNKNEKNKLETEIVKHVNLVYKSRRSKVPTLDLELKEKRTRSKKKKKTEGRSQRAQREMDFIEWESDHVKYENSTSHGHAFGPYDIYDLPIADHMTHESWEHRVKNAAEERYHRERISSGIRQGVKHRIENFGTPRKLPPVLDMTFKSNLK